MHQSSRLTSRFSAGLTRRFTALAAAAVLLVTIAVPLSTGPAHAAGPCDAASNAIVCENSKPGTNPAVWDIAGAGDRTIQGFATDISVNVGSRVDFKIDSDVPDYTVDIYRTGWYQGLGARFIDTADLPPDRPVTQGECITDAATQLYDCGTWGVSAFWDVPADAVSGVYVALLTRTDTGGSSHIIFIVRDEASHSDVLFQTSDPTWHAYNAYGGSSFYQGGSNGRAYKLSYNRPFDTRASGNGRDFYFSSEYAQVRFLEKNGYDVSYFSGVDTDRRGALLKNHKTFLSVGHDEYWSGAQRSNIEAARDAGVNLQFLGGNDGYWRTRYEPSADASATPYRTLVSYKETWSRAKIDPSSVWTGTFRDPRFAPQSAGAAQP
ncbi:MAG: N,N-dimethylformamidase beta subunit family domain-containing protein [Mycetocola sp.]